jgi:glycosyltransferase involved in cell wall biosynthesis
LGLTGLSTHGILQTKRALQNFPEMEGRIATVWPSSEMPTDLNLGGSELGNPIRFGQFGRLVTQKGHFLAIAALKRAIVLGGDVELHIFGEGIDRNHLLELVRALDIEDRVFFHGQYLPDDAGRLINGIDVGLVSSIHEGFGLVMLEMMSRSKPVISTDVGSAREVLEGLGGGWVVPVADTEAMAQAMLSCCRNRTSTLQKGEEAKVVWQKHFTPEAMFSRYLDFWKKCGAQV